MKYVCESPFLPSNTISNGLHFHNDVLVVATATTDDTLPLLLVLVLLLCFYLDLI